MTFLKSFRAGVALALSLAIVFCSSAPAAYADDPARAYNGDGYGMLVDSRGHCIIGVANAALSSTVSSNCGAGTLLYRTDNSTFYVMSSGAFAAWAPTLGATTVGSLTSTGAVSGTTGTFTGVLTASAGTQGNYTLVTLTESSATTFATVTLAAGGRVGGEIHYSIEADDATEYQARSGVLPFSAIMKGTAITCTVATVTSATEVVAVSSGTLTNTMTCADGGTGALQFKANAVSSLTQTTLRIRYRVDITGTATVTGS